MAIALVASVGQGTSGTSSAIDTTGANFIAASVGTVSANPNFSDSKGNTWVLLIRTAVTIGYVSIYYCIPTSVGTGHTFTSNVGASFPSFNVAAFSGVEDVYTIGRLTTSANGSGTSIQPGAVTPGTLENLLITGMAYRDTTSVSINGGFTITSQNPFIGGTAAGSALAYLIQTGAASANPTWSWTNSVTMAAGLFTASATITSGSGGGAFAYASA